MYCPHCGSDDVETKYISETRTHDDVKGFSCLKALLGYIFCSTPGLLCGLCGMGEGTRTVHTTTRNVNVCRRCGYRF